MNTLVSIIVPIYNRRKLIQQCIDSIIVQSYRHWELLIIDDGSNDNSAQVVNGYVIRDKRIKYYVRNKSPKGAPTCRNLGLNNSKGNYVVFLDSDDLLAPWCLEERLKNFQIYNNHDFLVFQQLSFKEHPGDARRIWNYLNKPQDDIYRFLIGDTPWQTSSVIWKSQSLKRIGAWKEELLSWQDCDLHIRALCSQLIYKKFDEILPDNFIRRNEEVVNMSSSFFASSKIEDRMRQLIKLCAEEAFLSSSLMYTEATAFNLCQNLDFYSHKNQTKKILFYISQFRKAGIINVAQCLTITLYSLLNRACHKYHVIRLPRIKGALKFLRLVMLPELSQAITNTKLCVNLPDILYQNLVEKLSQNKKPIKI